MAPFWTYFNSGLMHMLDISAYLHILFLLALTVPYDFKSWKKILILISLFTLGHTIASLFTAFNILTIKSANITVFVPIAIFTVAFYNIILAGKSSKKDKILFTAIITACYGIIHGFGFSNYFNSTLPSNPTDKVLPVFEFSLGIQASQMAVVILSLLTAYVIQTLFKFSQRDWILMISAFTIGVIIPVILQNKI